jgi:hypothetical protein
MQQNSDLIELLVALNAAGGEYLLIGAYAVAFYGHPRATKIDMSTSIDGVTFTRAWETRVCETYQRIPVNFIARAELITNKRKTGRPQDIADIANLEALTGKDGTDA